MNILFFSPYAYYSVHALPESIVAEALKNNGHEIISIGCNGIYSGYCLSMSRIPSTSSKKSKERICFECKKNRNLIRNEFSFKSINIDDFLNPDEISFINDETKNLNIHKYIEYRFENIPIGRYALYEFLLNRKLNSTVLNDIEWIEYKLYFKNAFLTLIGGRKILELVKPDRVVTYNSYYSTNHIFCEIAARENILHYTIHAGSHHKYRYSEMTIFKGYIPAIFKNSPQSVWKYYINKPLSKTKINKVVEHIDHLLEATSPWVYTVKSNGKTETELRNHFGIHDNQKVLLATMASTDERFAAAIIDVLPPFKESIFKTQQDWINYLIEFIKNDPSLFLIIRLHPREFPNKRESILSKQAVFLNKLFENLPRNVAVNYPKDSISLHDLLKITDVGLNATSTSGLELLLFGVPVVIYDRDQLFSYGRELNLYGSTIDEYKEQIYKAIELGWSMDNVIKSYRWLSYISDVVAIDISDGFSTKSLNQTKSLRHKIYRKVLRLLNLNYIGLLKPIKNRNQKLKNQELLTMSIEKGLDSHLDEFKILQDNNASFESERKLVKTQLLKFVNFIAIKGQDNKFSERINKMCNETK